MTAAVETLPGLADALTALAAVIAAITALLAHLRVKELDKTLNERQAKLDENQRILNDGGTAIPLDEAGAWGDYDSQRAAGKGRRDAASAALRLDRQTP